MSICCFFFYDLIDSIRYPSNNTQDYTTTSDASYGRMERQTSEDYQDDFEDDEGGYNDGGTTSHPVFDNYRRGGK